jgi:enamine deaminase RidA (YjgF/YER057c/UK114 family)
MDTVIHDPTKGIYPATPDYVHALEVQMPNRLVYVSGTMGLDTGGVAGGTLEEQLGLVWSNLRVILASAEMTVANIIRVTSYLRDAAYARRTRTPGSRPSKGGWFRQRRSWWRP